MRPTWSGQKSCADFKDNCFIMRLIHIKGNLISVKRMEELCEKYQMYFGLHLRSSF